MEGKLQPRKRVRAEYRRFGEGAKGRQTRETGTRSAFFKWDASGVDTPVPTLGFREEMVAKSLTVALFLFSSACVLVLAACQREPGTRSENSGAEKDHSAATAVRDSLERLSQLHEAELRFKLVPTDYQPRVGDTVAVRLRLENTGEDTVRTAFAKPACFVELYRGKEKLRPSDLEHALLQPEEKVLPPGADKSAEGGRLPFRFVPDRPGRYTAWCRGEVAWSRSGSADVPEAPEAVVFSAPVPITVSEES